MNEVAHLHNGIAALGGEAHPEPAVNSNSVIVIHPGSQNIRVGCASDPSPKTALHCIAKRHKRVGQTRYTDAWLVRPSLEEVELLLENGISDAEDILNSRPLANGSLRTPTNQRRLLKENSAVVSTLTNEYSDITLTDTSSQPDYLVAEKALYLDCPENYSIHWPIRHGQLNVHRGPGGSLTSVLSDMERIWSTIITDHLHIPVKNFCFYRVIVLVPDTMSHQHMKHMMTLVLERLKFKAAILHQESICATYGAGLASACVVDVGDQKTSICCVDDGISEKSTRLLLQYGGSDITRCFYNLLIRSGILLSQLSLDSYIDGMILQDIKHKFAHLDQDTQGVYEQTIDIHRPGHTHHVQYRVKVGDEAILAPLGLFCPELFGLEGTGFIHTMQNHENDPDDPYDEAFLHATRRSTQEGGKLGRKKESVDASTSGIGDDPLLSQHGMEDMCDPQEHIRNSRIEVDEDSDEGSVEERQVDDLTVMGIDEAIVQSIEKCDPENRKKMYSCILVVGGGAMFAGSMSWLQYRVWSCMSPQARSVLEVMDVMNRPKDLDPRMICWKGATLMLSLDTTQELWVGQKEWQHDGVRILREKTPFIW